MFLPSSSFFSKIIIEGKEEFSVSIGEGLFTSEYLKGGDHVAFFQGEVTTMVMYKILEQQGKGGYAIQLKKGYVLDCYQNAKKGICLASMANCPRHVKKRVVREGGEFSLFDVQANCEIFVNHKTNSIALRVKKTNNIICMSELCWTYGNSYNL